MAHKNLNLLTIIVATYGKQDHGITVAEIIDRSDGNLTKPTVHRLLRTIPGFKKASYPVWPTGYYFDAKTSSLKNLDIKTNQILNHTEPYKIKTKFGEVKNVEEYKPLPIDKVVLALCATNKFAEVVKAASGGIKWVCREVNSGNLTEPLKSAEKQDTLARILRARNAAWIFYNAYEQLLTDPSLQGSEWFKPFDQKIEE